MNMFYLIPLIFSTPFKDSVKKTPEAIAQEKLELKEAFVAFKTVCKQEEEETHA